MEQSTFWELINKFAFNLFKIKEVANILIKPKDSYEDFSSETKMNILLKSKTIIQSFRTNLKAIIKKSEYAIFNNDELINKTAKELSDIIQKIAPDNELLFLIAKCNSLMNIYLCTITLTMDISKLDKIYKNLNPFKFQYFYRGHQNYKYNLLPSFYRDLKVGENEEITYGTICKKYKELGLVDKYRDIFNDNNAQVDARMMSFIQHSISYSPLLDITESKDIATIFATSPKGININKYESTDAALYCFAYLKDRPFKLEEYPSTTDACRSIRVFYRPNKIKLDEKLRGKYLFEMDYNDFKVNCRLTKSQTNDRAIVQRGHFLLMINGYIINGCPLVPFDQFLIIKLRISSKRKKELYLSLIESESGKRIGIGTLMDPYSYFLD